MSNFTQRIFLLLLISTPKLRGQMQAQDVVRMSLEEAINYATANTNTIKNSKLNVTDADLRIKENTATGLPQVNGSLSYQYFPLVPQILLPDFVSPSVYGVLNKEGVKNGSGQTVQFPTTEFGFSKASFQQKNSLSASISASQLIFSGSYTVAVRAARLYRQFVDGQLVASSETLKNQVIDAYVPALLISESVATIDKNIKNLEGLLKEIKATYKAGFVEQLDVDRLDLSLNNLKTERENLDRQRELVLNALKFTIGYPLEKGLEPTDDINKLMQPTAAEDLAGAIDFNRRAEYKVVNQGIELQKLNVDLNKAGYLPNVMATAGFTENVATNNLFSEKWNFLPSANIGISASINIWDSKEKSYKIQRAQLALQQAALQKNDLERAITLQVLNARIAYINAQKRVENQQHNLALAERIYNTTQTKYKAGIGSSLEITTAEQSLYTAQQNVRQAQYDLLVAQKGLQKALGK